MSDDRNRISKWLLTDARRLDGLKELLGEFAGQLLQSGVPLDRATFGVPVLHPIAQSSFCSWDPEKGAIENSLVWDATGLEKLRNSPMYSIYKEGQGVDWSLDSEAAAQKYSVGADLRASGFTHYVAFALPFSDGSFKAMTVQTKNSEGFSTENINLINGLTLEISATVEHYTQKNLARTLADTFIGKRAGTRVLDGQVHRGDGEFIEAVIWMSDLRGFTQFAQTREPAVLLDAINTYFEVITHAVSENNGEVLKFIGDAVLAIFPVDGDKSAALRNAEHAIERVLSAKNDSDWPDGLEFGIGLHIGEVFYGNIGGRTRLDFTVIGQAVNLVSRIEGLCRDLSARCLVSEEVALNSERMYVLAAEKTVKGVDYPVKIYRR